MTPPIDHPTDHPTDHPIDHPTDHPIDHPIDPPVAVVLTAAAQGRFRPPDGEVDVLAPNDPAGA